MVKYSCQDKGENSVKGKHADQCKYSVYAEDPYDQHILENVEEIHERRENSDGKAEFAEKTSRHLFHEREKQE